jgi:hypothetical protein
MFRLMGKEIDNSVYFTLYGLGKIAESFKKVGPYHGLIRKQYNSSLHFYYYYNSMQYVDVVCIIQWIPTFAFVINLVESDLLERSFR